jgi:hypothetical protein
MALVVVVLLVAVLAILFSSPDVPPVTLQAWSSAQPIGFTHIALSELEGTSTTGRAQCRISSGCRSSGPSG